MKKPWGRPRSVVAALPHPMRIAVVGAGGVGTFFAGKLAQAGHEVTVVARNPARRAALSAEGVQMRNKGRGPIEHVSVRVAAELVHGDHFDLVLACVQRHQIDALVPTLAANSSPRIMFVFNCAAGADNWADTIGRERQLWGFPSVIAELNDSGVLDYRLLPGPLARLTQITTIGRVDGRITDDLLALRDLFRAAGIPAVCSPDIDAWLKSRGALMAPMMAVARRRLEYRRGPQFSRAETTEMAHAVHTALAAVRASGVTPTPTNLGLIARLPIPVLATALWAIYTIRVAKHGLLGHSDKTPLEIAAMLADVQALAAGTEIDTAALSSLTAHPPEPTATTDHVS
ncbi:2-dehydropantoate 2-reductase N-terminal domain-containing protein [Nocardia sp. NPDC051030]|uniref:ketopantoate reductase family protein n=1 Tax=Nocardia sp. NPDC051030 TaxID=3155162 RepID=UPI00343458F9